MKRLIGVFLIVASSGLLSAQQTHNITLVVNQPPELVADAGDDIYNTIGVEVTIGGNPAASGGTEPYTYLWSPVDYLSEVNSPNPILTLWADETYVLTVTDERNCTDMDTIDVIAWVSVDAISSAGLRIYPNPAREMLIIESLTENAGYQFELFDDLGQNVFTQINNGETKNEIDISELSPGIYFIRISCKTYDRTVKLIIH